MSRSSKRFAVHHRRSDAFETEGGNRAAGGGDFGDAAATGAGRCAAADTSADEPIAAVMALPAVASSRPSTISVSSVSARGNVLIVTSVMAASVPQEPARSLQRS